MERGSEHNVTTQVLWTALKMEPITFRVLASLGRNWYCRHSSQVMDIARLTPYVSVSPPNKVFWQDCEYVVRLQFRFTFILFFVNDKTDISGDKYYKWHCKWCSVALLLSPATLFLPPHVWPTWLHCRDTGERKHHKSTPLPHDNKTVCGPLSPSPSSHDLLRLSSRRKRAGRAI